MAYFNPSTPKALVASRFLIAFISASAKEWRELYRQILDIVEEMQFKLNKKETNYEQIHRALLAGLLGNIGFKDGDNDAYSGARSIRFHVAPGSCLKKTRPKWVMAAELVDTSKLYARCVAKIEPDWIEPLARELTNSTYSVHVGIRKKHKSQHGSV